MGKTYVKIAFNSETIGQKFETIDDAVAYAEQHHETDENDILKIYVYNTDGELCDRQECSRNPYSGDFVYYAWGVYGENFFDDSHRVSDSEIFADGINSEQDAREIAETFRNKFKKFDRVTIANYSQTVNENIGDLGEEIVIYDENED